MLLRNRLKSRLGAKVLVNGTQYAIDGDGFCDVANDADAQKMLSMREWELVEKVKAATEPARAPLVATPAEQSAVADDTAQDPPEPPEGEVWPDPVDTMSLAYLRKMATAYGVRTPPNIKKETLIAKINVAMFE